MKTQLFFPLFLFLIAIPACSETGARCDCPMSAQDIPADDAVTQRDTIETFHPQDSSTTCFITSYYAETSPGDSIVEKRLGGATIRCIWDDACSRLFSIYAPVNCDDINAHREPNQ
ncbi:MAG: hypothetical protein R3301_06905 [Saprospiraceae bacterium]|nr:hypothetical protein [Saprospiraceae bacterium]